MAEFKFKSSKKPFIIKDENDNILKEYTVDFFEEKTLKNVMKKIDNLSELSKIDMVKDENSIEKLKALSKDIIDTVLNNSFDELFTISGNNIICMVELVKELSNFMNDNFNERIKKYI